MRFRTGNKSGKKYPRIIKARMTTKASKKEMAGNIQVYESMAMIASPATPKMADKCQDTSE